MLRAYCYGGDGGEYAGKGMMSEETTLRAVGWLVADPGNAEKVNSCFFGGEPLRNYSVVKKSLSCEREKATPQPLLFRPLLRTRYWPGKVGNCIAIFVNHISVLIGLRCIALTWRH
jgi:hypothetical protein